MRGHRRLSAVLAVGLAAPGVTLGGPFARTTNPPSATATPAVRLPVEWAALPPDVRQALAKPLSDATIRAKSGVEEVAAKPELYAWLLDHPDRVSRAWPRLGVPCVRIDATPDGLFHWADDNGSRLSWRQVVGKAEGRVWLAEGKYRPGPLMPLIPVTAVAVLHHRSAKTVDGPRVVHSAEVFVQTDSRAANLVARLLGPAAPRMADEGAKQLLFFFAGVAQRASADAKAARVILAP